MIDPSPSAGMPEIEFVELYNASQKTLNLKDWTWSDLQRSVKLREHLLQPGEYLILCPAGQASSFSAYGKVMELSPWPSLNNDIDVLRLQNAEGLLMDSVAYGMAWYKDTRKQQGGFSLERKRVFSPCDGIQNWEASLDPLGATPGKVNSWTLENQMVPDLAFTNWE